MEGNYKLKTCKKKICLCNQWYVAASRSQLPNTAESDGAQVSFDSCRRRIWKLNRWSLLFCSGLNFSSSSYVQGEFSWNQEFTCVTKDEDEEEKTILQLRFSFESTHLKCLWVLLSHACNWGPFDDGERPPPSMPGMKVLLLSHRSLPKEFPTYFELCIPAWAGPAAWLVKRQAGVICQTPFVVVFESCSRWGPFWWSWKSPHGHLLEQARLHDW